MKEINSSPAEKLWSRNYIMLIIISLAVGITNMALNATLPLYIGYIGGTSSIVGIIMAAFPAAALVARFFSGNLLDSKGRRLVLVGGAILVAIGTLLYNCSEAIMFLILMRVIHGLGYSSNSTALGTIVADITPAKRLADGIGYSGIALVLSSAVGPALGLYLVEKYNFRIMFWTIAAIAVFALICSFTIKYDEKSKLHVALPKTDNVQNKDTIQNKDIQQSSFIEKSALPAALVALLFTLPIAATLNFLSPYAVSLGISNIGPYFTVYAAAMFGTRVFSGKLTEWVGFTKAIIPAIALLITGMTILAFARTMPLFLVAAAINGLAFGTVMPMVNTITIRMAPVFRRGTANATYFCAIDIAVGVGALLWGVVVQYFGYPSIFIASAFCAAISILAYIFILRRRMIKLGIISSVTKNK